MNDLKMNEMILQEDSATHLNYGAHGWLSIRLSLWTADQGLSFHVVRCTRTGILRLVGG